MEKLSLQMDLGKPDEDFKNEKGNLELIYKTKKYGILCERKFEINDKFCCNWFCFQWVFLNNFTIKLKLKM